MQEIRLRSQKLRWNERGFLPSLEIGDNRVYIETSVRKQLVSWLVRRQRLKNIRGLMIENENRGWWLEGLMRYGELRGWKHPPPPVDMPSEARV